MAERIRGPRAIVGIRRRLVAVSTATWEVGWRRYFQGLERRYMASMQKAAPTTFHVKQKGPGSAFWANEAKISKELLTQQYLSMTQSVWTDVASTQVGKQIAFDLNSRGVGRIIDKVGTRITAMTESSQIRLSWRIEQGINAGQSTDKIEGTVRDLLRSWGETGGRAHVIALTETGNAYNLAATEGYRESGLVEMVEVYDGPDCGWTEHDDPDLADGSTRTLDEADEYPLSHPHCQRAFGPVVLTEENAPPVEPDAPAPMDPEAPPPEPEPEPTPDPMTFGNNYLYDEYADQAWPGYQSSVGDTAYQALEEYTGGSYAPINSLLRGSFDDTFGLSRAQTQELIRGIDKAMVPLPDTLTVQRAVYDDAFKEVLAQAGIDTPLMGERIRALEKILPGQVLEDPGYLSTSMTVDKPVFSNPIQIQLIVPKGTPSAPARMVSAFDYEKELLLHRGTRYIVTSADYDGMTLRVKATVLE
jgi:hypothetical protein